MELVYQISGWILSAGWFISGVLFAWQYIKILRTRNAEGISWPTFAGFSFLNANATLYGYLSENFLWLPGTILAAISCALIAVAAYRGFKKT